MILMDHQIFYNQFYGGISRIFIELLQNESDYYRLPNIFHKNRYLLPIKKCYYLGRLLHLDHDNLKKINEKTIEKLFLNGDFDVVHATYFDCDYLIKAKIPYVLHVYDMLITVSDDDLLKEKFDRAVSHAKKLIFISNFTQDEFYKKYKHLNQPSCVIYLGVNEVFYEKKSDLNKIDLNKIRIGYSGVRAGHKNFKFVVDSLRSSPYSKNIMLYCFGGGRFNTNEKKYIKESGLKVLRYRGDDKKLLKFYRSLDVFIFPSLVEGFGIPPLEAMAMGIPLLASNRASIPEVCREGAIYFNPEDSISLQSAFKSFLDQSNQEEIIQTGINVSRKYNWLSSCNNIRKFITD